MPQNILEIDDTEKYIVLIDGAATYTTAKNLGYKINWEKLRSAIDAVGYMVRANYYTVVDSVDDNKSHALIRFLEYNGFNVCTRNIVASGQDARNPIRYPTDVMMAVDALRASEKVEHVVIFSGKSSLIPLVEELKRKSVRTTIVSTVSYVNGSSACSDELRRCADNFVDMVNFLPQVSFEEDNFEFNSDSAA